MRYLGIAAIYIQSPPFLEAQKLNKKQWTNEKVDTWSFLILQQLK